MWKQKMKIKDTKIKIGEIQEKEFQNFKINC